MSTGTVANMTPVTPAKTKLNSPPRQNSIGVVSLNFPRQMVPSQANTFTPVGTAMSMVLNMKKLRIHWATPLGKIW